jgi:hypothetical protein
MFSAGKLMCSLFSFMVASMKKSSSWAGRTLITASVAGAVSATVLTAGTAMAAPPAKPLPCRASMSNSHPADYHTTDVLVHTAARARVTTRAYYRTTTTTHRGIAGGGGGARIPYRISDATPGYRVKVSVSVVKGSRSGRCSTSFTPHR